MATQRQTPTVLREPVYMVDFAVFKPDEELKINLEACADAAWSWKHPDGAVSGFTSSYHGRDFRRRYPYVQQALVPAVMTADRRIHCHM